MTRKPNALTVIQATEPAVVIRGQSADDREDDQAQDVVDHRRAEDDLAFRRMQTAEIVEHAGRNADAGGRERRACDDALLVLQIERATNEIPSGERQGDAHDSDHRGIGCPRGATAPGRFRDRSQREG